MYNFLNVLILCDVLFRLEIENEQLFIDISEVLRRAVSWEERAKSALEHVAHISDFQNIIR